MFQLILSHILFLKFHGEILQGEVFDAKGACGYLSCLLIQYIIEVNPVALALSPVTFSETMFPYH